MTTVEKNSREKERRGGVRNRGFFNVIWRPAVSQQLHQPAAHAFYRLFLWRYNIIWKIKNSPIQVVDYVGVLVFPHHQNLIDDQLFLGLLLQVHLLNGHLRRQKKKQLCASQQQNVWKALWKNRNKQNDVSPLGQLQCQWQCTQCQRLCKNTWKVKSVIHQWSVKKTHIKKKHRVVI